MIGRAVKVIAALLVSAAALWLSFRKIDWTALGSSLHHIRYAWVAAAVVNSLIGVFLLGVRWKILLKPRFDFPHGDLFKMNILSQYANIVMPARMGEIVRVYLASRVPDMPAAYALGTLGAEKLLDLFIFAGLWMSVPFFLRYREVGPSLGLAFLFFLASAAAYAFLAFRPGLIAKAVRFVSRFLPRLFSEKTRRWGNQAVEAFGPLRNPRIIGAILLWTIVLILNQVLTNYLVFLGTGVRLPVQAALLVLLALQAGAIPPSVPGKIGIYEYSVILALSAFAVPSDAALLCAVVLHIVVYLPKIVLGAIFMAGKWKKALSKNSPRKFYNEESP